jgi:DNA polymerase elongation subunit (family B)
MCLKYNQGKLIHLNIYIVYLKMDQFVAFVYSWHVDDEGTIHGFALDPENKTVHLEIQRFTPYVYMELPREVEWTELKKQAILSAISEFPEEIHPSIKSFNNKKRLYDANVIPNPKFNPRDSESKEDKYIYKTYPYLFLAFKTRVAMNEFMKKMSYGTYIPCLGKKHRFKFHEHLASPILQFTCLRKIPVTGWISGKGRFVMNLGKKTSSCQYEYIVDWRDIHPCEDQIILKTVPCPTILMFDGEANSDNIATMPKNRPNDKMFQISFAVTRHGSNKVVKHLLSLGELDQEAVGSDVIMHTYPTEGDLLIGFCNLIHEIDPQVIGGYNILGWDFMYLIQRAKLNGVFEEFSKYGYLKGVQAKEKNISWSSSAFNSQNFTLLDAPGRLLIDMLPLVRRDFKFSRYDLGSVSTEILGQTKDPLTHRGIFKCYRIFSKASLSLVGCYCVKDSVVTLMLFDKLKTWVGMCQMSAIFGVGILDLYTQGQQLKIYSQVYRECFDKNIVVEHDAFQCAEDETYTGAIVLEPEPGMYKDVVTFDFASLYPSVMMANNICYSTRVTDPNIPDEDCHVFDFTDHIGCEHDTTKRLTKVKKVICARRYYRFLKSPAGVLPTLLRNLISKRKSAKKEGELEEVRAKTLVDPEAKKNALMYAMVCDMKQLALKVSANSMYGGLGVRKGKLPFMPGAICTTAGGRDALLKAKRLVMERYPGKDVYGDSVTEDTPILIRYKGKIMYRTIDNLPEVSYYLDEGDKEVHYTPPIEVWSDSGFTHIKRVIRHKTSKSLYRVLTHTGLITVTEDHSLLSPDSSLITPTEVVVGTKLLHHSLPSIIPGNEILAPYSKGLFLAEGSCGTYDCPSGVKSSWAINNTNLNFLNKARDELIDTYPSFGFKILDTMESSACYKLVVTGSVSKFTKLWREMFYDERKNKIVPDEVFECGQQSLELFVQGYYDGDGDTEYTRVDNKGDIGSAGLFFLFKRLGYSVSLNNRKDKPDVTRLTATKNVQRRDPIAIKKIWKYPSTEQYVYDLETENHHFSAGIGEMVVHNTDSLMYIFDNMERFQTNDGKTDYTALEKHACVVAEDISKSFPPPMKLEYENTAEDFFILTKKRYMTKLTTGKYKKRGIMVTRRDNAPACRNVYEGLLKYIFGYKSKEETILYLIESLNDIYSHRHPTKEYSITKSIKEVDQYKVKPADKDPEKRRKQFANKFLDPVKNTDTDYLLRSLPGHVQLAERMRRRGMFVEAGSRIDFVVTTSGGIKGKIWQKIESSEYYREHSDIIRLDMNYYCKSLTNPGDQAMETAYKYKGFFKEQLELRILKQECLDELKKAFAVSILFHE